MMGKPRGVTHSTVWPDLEMSLALSVSQSCNTIEKNKVTQKVIYCSRGMRRLVFGCKLAENRWEVVAYSKN